MIQIAEILVIIITLAVLFSLSGMPLILLSTFSPASNHGKFKQDIFDPHILEAAPEGV